MLRDEPPSKNAPPPILQSDARGILVYNDTDEDETSLRPELTNTTLRYARTQKVSWLELSLEFPHADTAIEAGGRGLRGSLPVGRNKAYLACDPTMVNLV